MERGTNESEADYRIGSLDTCFEIIHELERLSGGGVSEVASSLDVPTSTAHVYMKSLHGLGYLVKEGSTYSVSLRFLERGGIRRQQLDIFEVARHEVDELSTRSGEVAHLGVEEEGKRVLVYSSESDEGVFDNSPVGQFAHMHSTALGKSMLAYLPDDRIREIVDRHGLPASTENTVTDVEALFDEVAATRDRGYAIGDEERRNGIRSLAVPITDRPGERAIAAVGVSGPRNKLTGDRMEGELLELIKQTANVVELKYEHYGP